MKEIQKDTKYWLIRPGVGAKCFEKFYKDNCIAIGWDKIGNINDGDNITSLDNLKELVKYQYGDMLSDGRKSINRKVGDIASKIYRFTYEVKENDILEIRFGNRVGKYKIIDVREVVRKEEAALMYKVLEEDPEVLKERN